MVALPLVVLEPETLPERPRTRGDCVNGPRPCPWLGCRHHLGLDVDRHGRVTLAPEGKADEQRATCALDVAEDGRHSFDEIAEILNCRKGTARSLADRGRAKMRTRGELLGGEATKMRR